MVPTSEFLKAIFGENGPICLRAFPAKRDKETPDNSPVKLSVTIAELTKGKVRQLRDLNRTRGVYFVVNTGGHTDAEITRYNAFFCEADDTPIAAQHTAFDAAPIPPSIRVETRKSVHGYWPIEGDCSEAEWRQVQGRLISFFASDPSINNPSRLMRMPGFDHLRLNGNGLERTRVKITHFDERRYTVAQMLEALPPVPIGIAQKAQTSKGPFDTWDQLNDEARARIRNSAGARTRNGWTHAPGLCHGSTDGTALYVATNGGYRCMNDCPPDRIRTALGLPARPTRQAIPAVVSTAQRESDQTPTPDSETGRAPVPLIPSYREFMSQSVKDEEVIALEARRGELVLVQSVTNRGKTTLTLNATLCLAAGRKFLTLAPATIARRVIYLQFEGSCGRFQSDLHIMERMFDVQEKDQLERNFFPVHAPEIDDEPLTFPRHLNLFELEARRIEPDLIVIDTASAAFSIRSENDNSEIIALEKQLIRIARRLACVIVVIHHIGKAKAEDGHTREAAHRGRGASSFGDNVAAIFNLECNPATPDLVTLICAKRKTGPEYEIPIKLDRDARWFFPTNDTPPRPLTNREIVLRALTDSPTPTRVVVERMAGVMSQRTVQNCLDELVIEGSAFKPKYGYWQRRNGQVGKSATLLKGVPTCQLADPTRQTFENSELSPQGAQQTAAHVLDDLPTPELTEIVFAPCKHRELPSNIYYPPGCDLDVEWERLTAAWDRPCPECEKSAAELKS